MLQSGEGEGPVVSLALATMSSALPYKKSRLTPRNTVHTLTHHDLRENYLKKNEIRIATIFTVRTAVVDGGKPRQITPIPRNTSSLAWLCKQGGLQSVGYAQRHDRFPQRLFLVSTTTVKACYSSSNPQSRAFSIFRKTTRGICFREKQNTLISFVFGQPSCSLVGQKRAPRKHYRTPDAKSFRIFQRFYPCCFHVP